MIFFDTDDTNLGQELDPRTKLVWIERVLKFIKRTAIGEFNTFPDNLAQCDNKKLLQMDLKYSFIRLRKKMQRFSAQDKRKKDQKMN